MFRRLHPSSFWQPFRLKRRACGGTRRRALLLGRGGLGNREGEGNKGRMENGRERDNRVFLIWGLCTWYYIKCTLFRWLQKGTGHWKWDAQCAGTGTRLQRAEKSNGLHRSPWHRLPEKRLQIVRQLGPTRVARFMVMKTAQDFWMRISRSSNMNLSFSSRSAPWIVMICTATTESTVTSIRLNSSKQPQAPAWSDSQSLTDFGSNIHPVPFFTKTRQEVHVSPKTAPAKRSDEGFSHEQGFFAHRNEPTQTDKIGQTTKSTDRPKMIEVSLRGGQWLLDRCLCHKYISWNRWWRLRSSMEWAERRVRKKGRPWTPLPP